MQRTAKERAARRSENSSASAWITAAARRAGISAAWVCAIVLGGATAAAAAGGWTFTDRSEDGWCFVQHDDDIQIWFGTSSDGQPLLTVDVRQNLARAELSVDGTGFSVRSNPRSDDEDWRELEVLDDHEAFLDAASTGTILRAGIRNARLDGLADLLARNATVACLADVGWSRTAAPQSAAAPMAGGVLGNVIFASGEIDAGFTLALERALAGAGEEPTLVIGESPGGSIDAAERAARALRNARARVIVAGECASACVSLMAGGAERSLGAGGRLGVHRTTFHGGADAERGQAAVAAAARFFREMGVNVEVALLAAATPSNRMHWLTAEEARDLGLVTP